MTPHAYAPQSDNESLQADVMRFMAIIAFCLIAILALVRHAEPAADAEASKAPAVEEVLAAEIEPAALEKPVENPEPPATVSKPAALPDPALAEIPRRIRTPESWRQPLPKAEPAPVETPRTPRPEPKPQRLEAQAVAAEAREQPSPTTAPVEPTPAPDPADEDGLSLRFASDGDFLRLIARGDIRVYAFHDANVLTLTSAYDFLKARSPGQLYELMRETIPSVIVDALVRSRRERADSDSFSWGITLPAAIQQQISAYLAKAASGQLVIDRYGDVHHVASR